METKAREALVKIRKFVDSVEEVDGKKRFDTMDGVSAIYSLAILIIDINVRLNRIEKEEMDYDKRTKKFASR